MEPASEHTLHNWLLMIACNRCSGVRQDAGRGLACACLDSCASKSGELAVRSQRKLEDCISCNNFVENLGQACSI